jgi:hypothetical protein
MMECLRSRQRILEALEGLGPGYTTALLETMHLQRPPRTLPQHSGCDRDTERRQAQSLPAFAFVDPRHDCHSARMVAVEYPAARTHRRFTGRQTMILRNTGARLLLLGYCIAVFLLFG